MKVFDSTGHNGREHDGVENGTTHWWIVDGQLLANENQHSAEGAMM